MTVINTEDGNAQCVAASLKKQLGTVFITEFFQTIKTVVFKQKNEIIGILLTGLRNQ